MLTALLLLLGLSGAGAGLYSVLREPKPSSSPDRSGEVVYSRGNLPPGKKQIPSGDFPSREQEQGRDYSSGGGPGRQDSARRESRKQHLPEIKPESLPLGELGASEVEKDREPSSGMGEGWSDLGSPQVSYSADEIISKNSKFSHHRRPLINAENLLEKDKVQEALEIYKRTEARIPDSEIKEKLNQNIQDLKNYKNRKEKLDDLFEGEEDYSDEEGCSDKIRPPSTSSPIPIRDLAEAIREIAEAMSEALSKGFYPPYAPPRTDQPPASSIPPNTDKMSPPPFDENYKRQLPPNYFPAPIVYQIVSSAPGNFQAKYQPPESSDPNLKSDAGIPAPIIPPYSESSAPIPPLPQEQARYSPDHGILDLPDDTFFTREWDKYKDLPLTDRRSGIERRQKKDRRTNLSRRDRRSGEDRRKIDLFKEREEYLKKKAEEKKALMEERFPPEGRLSDKLEPFYPPPELPEIGLPDPENPTAPEDILSVSLKTQELKEIGLPTAETFRLTDPLPEERNLPPAVDFRREEESKNEIQLPDPEDISLGDKDSPEPPSLEIPPIELPRIEIPPIEIPPIEMPELDRPDLQKPDLPVIALPDPEEMRREMTPDGPVLKPPVSGDTDDLLDELEDKEPPEIEIVDGDLDEQLGEIEAPEEEVEEEKEPEKILHGVLELKPPEVDDAPFLTLTYDFSKIPHGFRLSKNYSIMEYSYYKYKPMLMKAQEFARRKMLKNALNYYRVIKSQNIPPEMRKMINRNIQDITEFMEKFLMAKGG